MTNRFYNETFSAALGTQAKSAALDAQFQLIQAGFDLLRAEVDSSVTKGDSFTSLDQVPSSLVGQGLKIVRVNAAGTALEFVSPGKLEIESVGGTAITAKFSDAGKLKLTTSGTPVTFTLTSEATQIAADGQAMEVGSVICVNQYGAGQVTFVGSGATIVSTDALLATRKQYAEVALVYLGGNIYLLIGERNAPTLGFASLTGGNAFTGAQTVAFQALTDAASIATDAALSNHFLVTLGGNRTLANPTNLRDGGIYNFYVKQDGTGSRSLGYGSLFKWPGASVPVLTTAANSLDLIIAQYSATLNILACSITKDVR